MIRTKFSAWDAVVAGLVLVAALALLLVPPLLRREGETLVVTTPEGSDTYALSEDRRFEITSEGITLTVVIEDGAAYVLHSDCPDGICRASGRISQSGQTILCAPAGVTLSVKGGGDGVDFVAG